MENNVLGMRIRSLRKEKGLTLEYLADTAFTKGYISQIELGRVTPSFKVLEHIADKLDMTIEDLLVESKKDLVNQNHMIEIESEYQCGNYDRVLSLIDKLKALKIKGLKIDLIEAKSYNQLKQFNQCLVLTKKIIDNNENINIYYLEAYALYGNSLFNKRLYQESIEIYKKTITLSQEYDLKYDLLIANTMLNMATAYQNLERYDEAIASYNEVIQFVKNKSLLEPHLDAFIRLGFCYYKKKNYEVAIKYLNDGVKINQILDQELQQAESLLILSYILLEQENYEDAKEHATCARSLFEKLNHEEGVVEILYILSTILKKMNLLTEGIDLLDSLYKKIEKIGIEKINRNLLKDIGTIYMNYELHQKSSYLFSILLSENK